MSKVYLFAVMLLAASFTGCLGGEDLEESSTLEPVGEDDDSGKPGVEFVGLFENYGQYALVAAIYDPDGYVLSYTIESSNDGSLTGGEEGCDGFGLTFTDLNSDRAYDCYPVYGDSVVINVCSDIEPVDQTITVKIEDNDGNKASAEYDIVFDDFECDDEQGESAPIATFFVQEGSDGVYHVEVIKVSKQEDLAGFSFYLKDETGSTWVGGGNGFGEIAMQNISGELYGIDQSYDGDDDGLKDRATNISNDNGTVWPVHFIDNDRDGMLSAGDQFLVYGSGNAANGPASDNWRLEIQYDPSGDIIGSAKML